MMTDWQIRRIHEVQCRRWGCQL